MSDIIYTAEAIPGETVDMRAISENVLSEHSYSVGSTDCDIVQDTPAVRHEREFLHQQTLINQLQNKIKDFERQLKYAKNVSKKTTKLNQKIGYDAILKNDKKIKYYTGLPPREVF